MEIETNYIRTKAGYKGQLLFNGDIIWESEEVYEDSDMADKAAWMKLNSSMQKLFSD